MNGLTTAIRLIDQEMDITRDSGRGLKESDEWQETGALRALWHLRSKLERLRDGERGEGRNGGKIRP